MKWSLKLGRFAGIDVFVHWTFVILLGWIFFAQLGAGGNVDAALGSVVFILAIFGCVALHEFGHALAARRYGIGTRDITLLPIGGVARLKRMPEKPRQELVVALAGPAVNFVIAAVIYIGLLVIGGAPVSFESDLMSGSFLARLMTVNVFLAVFNLLPAFPMDGGRVLRALLAAQMGRRRATQIAANIGQALAIILGVMGFFLTRNPFLILIAVFVYLGAQAEAHMVELTSLIRGLTVRDAMQTRFRTLVAEGPLSAAVDELLAGAQHDFPVMEGDKVVGFLHRQNLVKALAESGKSGTVARAMTNECPTVDVDERLDRAFEKFQSRGCTAAAVLEDGKIVGMLTMENVSELVMVNAALEKNAAGTG